jgi:predicted O-methyltransferase YrrM
MDDQTIGDPPRQLAAIAGDSRQLGFSAASEPRTGALLRVLAASKPGGRLLELGTGTGGGTAWLLDGLDGRAVLTSVDQDREANAVAGRHLGSDPRLTLVLAEVGAWLREEAAGPYDLIFADTWPGKFWDFEPAWQVLAVGGCYVIDDLLPQPNWPAGHDEAVTELLARLDERRDCCLIRMAWASGLVIAVKT